MFLKNGEIILRFGDYRFAFGVNSQVQHRQSRRRSQFGFSRILIHHGHSDAEDHRADQDGQKARFVFLKPRQQSE
jgi:ribonuclease BN (tRNA processing enzyme)